MTRITTSPPRPLGRTAATRHKRAPKRSAPAEGTRSTIVSAAQRVLEDEGYMSLTLRHVAGAAGVAVGNLTYYFPSKQTLVRAVIEAVFRDFSAGEMERLQDPSKSPGENLRVIIQWLMTESAAIKTSRVMRELWVMALHDSFVAGALDDFYDEVMAGSALYLRKIQPNLTEQTAAAIVHLVTMITEGTNILYGTRPSRAADLATMMRFAGDLLGAVIEANADGVSASVPAGTAPEDRD